LVGKAKTGGGFEDVLWGLRERQGICTAA